MLDCVDMEVAPQPDGRPSRSDTIIDKCKAAWENFKSFNRDATITAVTHALAAVRSHYLAIDLQAISSWKMRWKTWRRNWPATLTCSARWMAMTKPNDLLGEYSIITGEGS